MHVTLLWPDPWPTSNTINMVQSCVDAINATVLHKMERDMSEGGCQDSQSGHDWKSAKAAGVKTQEVRVSAPGIK